MLHELNCRICGKKFMQRSGKSLCCSHECSAINRKQKAKEYRDRPENKEKYRNWKKPMYVTCHICGEPIIQCGDDIIRSRYHEYCVELEAVRAMLNGEQYHNGRCCLALRRYSNYGYSNVALRRRVEESGITLETIDKWKEYSHV